MKFLFKITKYSVDTLLRGVDFEQDDYIITFKDGTSICTDDLNKKILLFKGGWVIYTTDENKLKS